MSIHNNIKKNIEDLCNMFRGLSFIRSVNVVEKLRNIIFVLFVTNVSMFLSISPKLFSATHVLPGQQLMQCSRRHKYFPANIS